MYTKIGLDYARTAIRFLLRAFDIKEINLPFFTCPTVWQAVQQENQLNNSIIKIKFYHINSDFLPDKSFNSDDFIIYTNYFGICSKQITYMSKKYKNLIIDNAHGFYSTAKSSNTKDFGLANFNSLRKFFNVPNGSFLSFNDKSLNNFTKNFNDLGKISKESLTILSKIDFEQVKFQRIKNFNVLNNTLKSTNLLNINLSPQDVPMIYPYFVENIETAKYIRKTLKATGIELESYWGQLKQGSIENEFRNKILPLPISQNLEETRLQKILDTILKSFCFLK